MANFEDIWDYTWNQFFFFKPQFQAFQYATTTQSIPSGTATLVNWDGSNSDSWLGLNLTTDTYTIPVKGVYRFTTNATWNGNGTGQRYSAIYQNGALVTTAICTRRANASTVSSNVDALFACNVGDTIRMYVFQDSGSAQNLYNTAPYQTTFTGEWVHT